MEKKWNKNNCPECWQNMSFIDCPDHVEQNVEQNKNDYQKWPDYVGQNLIESVSITIGDDFHEHYLYKKYKK